VTVVVIDPPPAVVTPAEAKTAGVFLVSDDDTMVTMLLAVAQADIDGPPGWLGRSIGVQTLEMRQPRFGRTFIELPCGPVRSIVSIVYGADAATLPSDQYVLYSGGTVGPVAGGSWPVARGPDSVRIRFQAGYDTDKVPKNIKYAVMLMAAQLRAAGISDVQLRSQTAEGIGSRTFLDPTDKAKMLTGTAERLLQPFKVIRV
jgi:hypothetical protein